jgi:precorrin-6A/cobalt-precorrin-6A reductase
MRILLLGGTAEARELAVELSKHFIHATLSLAGLTRATPGPLPTRSGGFGGVEGLLNYLQAERITHVIDATHPFAEQMSRHAAVACAQTGVQLLRLIRPAWPARPNWQHVANIAEAAAILPPNARVFLSLGAQSLGAFTQRPDLWCLTRSIELPLTALPGVTILARPPFTLEGELALMGEYAITHLVSKNAGGNQTAAKLDAAAQLGIAVVMVARPVLAEAPEYPSPAALLKALFP